ncbi:MAG: 50S ribosomal protein L23 [Muribaculaceae bacterium]|nr:50S ribosomal protein L23 [Muribaculaceae bacterium]
MDIMIKPIVTEQATKLTERRNQYTFCVSPEANKYQIKDLIEKLYGVKVVSVNTAVMRGKNKSRWTKSGLLRGKTASFKKAYVTIGEGQTIDVFSNI